MRISRRSFATRIGTGAAALQLAVNRAEGQSADGGRRLRYCIVGLGRISLQHFMPACKLSQYGQVTAFVSGHRDKADRYAAEYGVPAKNIYDYTNFDEIAKNADIDAVYIALPNTMHAEYTVRAAQAGAHVLCEKPMATSESDCRRMIQACDAAGVELMIAYRLHFEPANLEAVKAVVSGKIGEPRFFSSDFSYQGKEDKIRTHRAPGGGPIWDIGIYQINAARYLLRGEPVEVVAFNAPGDDRF